MAFYLIRGDLVNMEVDTIVANANVNLKMVEGVSRAIFHRAGDLELQTACRQIGHCDVGHAVITPSFNITNCKAIIHAVGPNYINGKHGEEKNLRSAYKNVFKIMDQNGFKSAAFPIISSDFNYPLRECYYIEKDEIIKYLLSHIESDIYVVLFKQPFDIFDDDFKDNLSHYVNTHFETKNPKQDIKDTNSEIVKEIKKLIEEKNIDRNELIVNANWDYRYLDRLFEESTFIPSKNMLLSLAVALKLPIKEIGNFLAKQGYVFGKNTMYELVVRYFVEKDIFDVFQINDCLFFYNLETLSKKLF